MTRILTAVLALLAVVGPAQAAPQNLPGPITALELRAGLRWDREPRCQRVHPSGQLIPDDDHDDIKDPPYIGPGISFALSPSVEARGSFDLDLDGPWRGRIGAARLEIAWRPWRN